VSWPPENLILVADAEQAKSTGGMIALLPSRQDAYQLVVPGGEPIEDLHLTLAYFGEDVSAFDPAELRARCEFLANSYGPQQCKVFGRAQFNASSPDACAVYLIGDNSTLTLLRDDVQDFSHALFQMPDQHEPFVPHVTAGYGLDPQQLTYEGPVLFDRIQLAWAGQDFEVRL
jgi:2'-5' RNA ligase